MARRRSRLYLIPLVFFTCVFLFGIYNLTHELIEDFIERKNFEEISTILDDTVNDNQAQGGMTPEEATLAAYRDMKATHPDYFGWLAIPDTEINYPVMSTPGVAEYYLHRNYDGEYSYSGTPFLSSNCFAGCQNYIIYGHHMANGTMFQSLSKYADPAYYEAHPVIDFNTVDRLGKWQVIGAFYSKILEPGETGFDYYNYVDLRDPELFNQYVTNVKMLSEYDTGITAVPGEELLTLSTCSYHIPQDGRFVVVAKRVYGYPG